ncbi:MAG: hypothetical protein PHR06_12975, partial [Candidatus Cloacimonetes bacterium]|nr:hypothetical protein [Candidatus Cloacimonadota bacterium]
MKIYRLMAVLIITVIAALAALNAANLRLEENGRSLRQGVNIEWFRSGTSLEDGTVVYTWSDTRFAGRDLFAQRLDAQGNKLWGENGLMVDNKYDRQEDPVVINTTDGCVVIAWVDFSISPTTGDIFAQKIDAEGNLLWQEGGVPVCTANDIQISLNIVKNNIGGAYIIWQDNRNPGGTDIYGANLDSNGNNLWIENGIAIADGNGLQNGHTFWEDGEGGAIISYINEYNSEQNINAKRINPDGTFSWTVTICDEPGEQSGNKISPDNDGGFIIAWKDARNGVYDIYAQRVTLNGQVMWQNNGIVVYADNYSQQNPRVATASDGGIFVVWEDNRNEGEHITDIYAQKISPTGQLLWENGIPLAVAESTQSNPRLRGDDNGGVIVAWDDSRNGGIPHIDIYAQHLNNAGEPIFAANGIAVCDEPGEQNGVLIQKSGDYYFINWADLRDGSVGLYYQVLDTQGNTQLADNGQQIYWGLSGNATNLKFIKNGDYIFYAWNDSRTPYVKIYLQVTDLSGNVLLQDNGIPITEYSSQAQNQFDITPYEDSGIVIAWFEKQISGDSQPYAQAINFNGDRLWGEDGVALSFLHAITANENIFTSTLNNEYYFGWTEYRYEISYAKSIYGNKADSNGNLLWGDDGLLVSDNISDNFITDMVGGYYLWHKNMGG